MKRFCRRFLKEAITNNCIERIKTSGCLGYWLSIHLIVSTAMFRSLSVIFKACKILKII